jgi:hypothetical protein
MVEFVSAQITATAALHPPDGLGINLPGAGIRRKLGRLDRAGLELNGKLQQQLGDIPGGTQRITARAVQLLHRHQQLLPEPKLLKLQFGDLLPAQRFDPLHLQLDPLVLHVHPLGLLLEFSDVILTEAKQLGTFEQQCFQEAGIIGK